MILPNLKSAQGRFLGGGDIQEAQRMGGIRLMMGIGWGKHDSDRVNRWAQVQK